MNRYCVLTLDSNEFDRLLEIRASDVTSLPGGHSEVEPPDPIPNSEVKRFSADGSVGSPHVRVGHRQALKQNKYPVLVAGYFFVCKSGSELVLLQGYVTKTPGTFLNRVDAVASRVPKG